MLEKEAKELLALVGGKENVNQLVHCATRLRFELKDDSLVKKEEIESNAPSDSNSLDINKAKDLAEKAQQQNWLKRGE